MVVGEHFIPLLVHPEMVGVVAKSCLVVIKSKSRFPDVGVIAWAIEKSPVEWTWPSVTQVLTKDAAAWTFDTQVIENIKARYKNNFFFTLNI